jgi:hypothetical protein
VATLVGGPASPVLVASASIAQGPALRVAPLARAGLSLAVPQAGVEGGGVKLRCGDGAEAEASIEARGAGDRLVVRYQGDRRDLAWAPGVVPFGLAEATDEERARLSGLGYLFHLDLLDEARERGLI